MNILEKCRLGLLLLVATGLFASCSDDDIVPRGEYRNPDAIGFSLSPTIVSVDSMGGSRSEKGLRYYRGVLALQQEDGNDTLYLHTSVCDEIAARTPAAGNQSMSRGVPVKPSSGDSDSDQNFETVHGSFGVTAIADGSTVYFSNEKTDKAGNFWNTATTYLWPAGEVQFYAYAPYYIDYAIAESSPSMKMSSYIDGITNTTDVRHVEFSYETPVSNDGNTDAEAQPDLMFAYNSTAKTADGSVPMHFRHALSAIRFKTDDVVSGTIKSITIGNVYGKGTCVFDGTAALASEKVTGDDSEMPACFTWTAAGEADCSYMQTINVANVQGTPQDLTANAGEATTFMMIPQTLPADAFVKVVIETEDGFSVVFQGSIGGGSWEAGKTYTYTISASSILWEYVFEVTSLSNPFVAGDAQKYLRIFEHTGVRSLNYTVKSYRRLASDPTQTEILPWEIRNLKDVNYEIKDTDTGKMGVKDSTAVTAMPDWVTLEPSTLKGDGSVDAVSYNVTVAPMKIWTSYSGDVRMQIDALKGSDNDPWDLSTHTHMGEIRARSTANCYIVHSGGTYMLPLVYGNAIEAGAVNESSYTYQSTGNETLSKNVVGNKLMSTVTNATNGAMSTRQYNFQNYAHPSGWDGVSWPLNAESYGITQPYISNLDGGNCTPYDACMVWTDAYNVVKEGSVELYEKPGATGGTPDGVKHFLKFTLNADYMQQGNIVLAVRDAAGEIMWSWHIWISDYDYTGTDPDYIGLQYGIKSFYEFQDVESEVNSDGVREAQPTNSGITYKFAMSNLGHCTAKTKALIHRKLVMDFVQLDDKGKVVSMENRAVFEHGMEFKATVGNNTYYQWGRKDPIVGIRNSNEGVKDHWVSESKYKYTVEQKRVYIYEAIRNPNIMYLNGDDATDDSFRDWVRCPGTSYFNLWNNYDVNHASKTGNNNNTVIKTVYDPSPVGFKMPPANSFKVITNDGYEGNSISENNATTGSVRDSCYFNGYWLGEAPGDTSGKKYALYTQIGGTGDLMPIECTGQRAYKAGLAGGVLGGNWNYYFVYLWLADPVMNTSVDQVSQGGSAYSVAIGPDSKFFMGRFFHPYMPAVKAMARPVRPIMDENYTGDY